MRLFVIAFAIIIIPYYSTAQVKKPVIKTSKQVVHKEDDFDHVFTKIEINAHTDRAAWDQHMAKYTRLADSTTIPTGSYTAIVTFIVDTKGGVTDVKATTDPGYGLAQKAVEVVKSYPGVWKPAFQCGRAVKSYLKQPVVFTAGD